MEDGTYLKYAEYKQFGGTLSKEPFLLLEYRAAKEIEKRTFGRVKEVEIDLDIKLCLFDLINELDKAIKSDNSITSESTDGYSVTYADINTIATKINNNIIDIIESYLLNKFTHLGVPLLYRGAM